MTATPPARAFDGIRRRSRVHERLGRAPTARPRVRAGRIVAIDTDHRLRDAGAAETVALDGGLLLPAFHDAHAHAHPVVGGIDLLQCDLATAVDAADRPRRVAEHADAPPEVVWTQGDGGGTVDVVDRGYWRVGPDAERCLIAGEELDETETPTAPLSCSRPATRRCRG